MRKRFRSGVNIARTQSFPGADVGSDHDLLMMTYHLRLERISEPKHTRLKFDLKSGKIPICWKPSKLWFAGSLHLSPSWTMKIQTWIQWSLPSTQQWLKQPVRSLANIVRRKKPWVTAEILDLCDKWRELRKKRFEPEGSEKYREVNNNIKRCMKKAIENWIGEQCS